MFKYHVKCSVDGCENSALVSDQHYTKPVCESCQKSGHKFCFICGKHLRSDTNCCNICKNHPEFETFLELVSSFQGYDWFSETDEMVNTFTKITKLCSTIQDRSLGGKIWDNCCPYPEMFANPFGSTERD